MLGLMLITATFSMFMSNTATTAMMLAILTPVLAAFPDKDPAKIGFVLAIPLAANLGGIGTPIGTPPNAVALKYLTGEHAISFGQWMGFAVPFVVLLLLLGWFLLGASSRAPSSGWISRLRGALCRPLAPGWSTSPLSPP